MIAVKKPSVEILPLESTRSNIWIMYIGGTSIKTLITALNANADTNDWRHNESASLTVLT